MYATPPVPVLVYLSGPARGRSDRLEGSVEVHREGYPPVRLEPRGQTYRLQAPDHPVWVNGERVDDLVLASGDVIELDSDGPLIRFRLYPPDHAGYKSLPEVFSDCVTCAKHDSPTALGRFVAFLLAMPRELATQTSLVFRSATVVGMLLLLGGSVWSFQQNRTLRAALDEQAGEVTELTERLAEVQGMDALMEQSEEASLTAEDFNALLAELAETRARLSELEERGTAVPRTIERAAAATIFLQGAYGFVDPASGRPVRLRVRPDGRPVYGPGNQPLVTLEGPGPELEVPYTGTGWVASDDGLVVTNRHVALPWEFDDAARTLVARGFTPVMRRFVGYLPDQPEPFAVEFVAASDEADVAVLRCDAPTSVAPFLTLADEPVNPGAEVLVLGYPLGIRALIVRTEPSFLEELQAGPELDFFEVAERLGERGFIAPLATRGIVGQSTASTVVYDAETTSGGSGGPVLSLNGQVVAVNAAILPEFGGSNIGVPIAHVRALLEQAAGS